MISHLFPAFPATVLLLGGCAVEGGFPSLAQRPVEREVAVDDPVRPAVDVPSDVELRGRIAELRRQAAEGERSFEAMLGPADAAIAAAGAAGSESWIEAQQALSRLEASRAATTQALAELDRLVVVRAEIATSSEDFAAIESAIAEVERIAASQQARWDRLRARLPALG